jgi:hypothetical protein
MAPFTCPKCSAGLSPQEVADGWCEACGKKLPPALRAAPAAAPGNSGVLPNAGWADRLLFALGLLFVAALLAAGVVRAGLPGVWKWLQAMFLFVIFLSLVNMLERYCQLYPHWRSAYRVCAAVCVLAGMAFAALAVLTKWSPFF